MSEPLPPIAPLSSATPASISVRQLDVDLSGGFPRHWNGGDAYRTHVFNALSMLFPQGEQAFIDSVRGVVPLLQARGGHEALLADIRAFIGQEATHRHMHRQFNDELARQGYVSRVEGYLAAAIPWGQRHLRPLTLLAFTVAYEHLTAVLGDGLLRHRSWTAEMTEPMRRLWQWHAAEEMEHKAVAFDAYRAAGGGEAQRILTLLAVLLEFMIMVSLQTTSMLWHDRRLLSWRSLTSALGFWWGREGVIWHMARHVFAFMKPGFHPWQQDNRDLLARWRAGSSDQYRVVGGAG